MHVLVFKKADLVKKYLNMNEVRKNVFAYKNFNHYMFKYTSINLNII